MANFLNYWRSEKKFQVYFLYIKLALQLPKCYEQWANKIYACRLNTFKQNPYDEAFNLLQTYSLMFILQKVKPYQRKV